MTTTLKFKVSNKKPPIYDTLHKRFGVEWDNGLIIAYGDTVHCKFDLPMPKQIHEGTHVEQQRVMGRDKWWKLYLEDDHFRLLQEIEAYTNEVNWIKQNTETTTREWRRSYIKNIVKTLSGSMYGYIISEAQAEKLFK